MLRLHDFSQSYPWPMEWLASLPSHYAVQSTQQLQEQPWMKGFLCYLGYVVQDLKKQMEHAALGLKRND